MRKILILLFLFLSLPAYADLRADVTATANSYKGVPYKWGGTDRNGVDCSGFIYAVFYAHNIPVPRMAKAQYKEGKDVQGVLKPGDLVFYSLESKADHVGIYIGEGRFLHSSTGKGKVVEARMDNPYYLARFLGARNIID